MLLALHLNSLLQYDAWLRGGRIRHHRQARGEGSARIEVWWGATAHGRVRRAVVATALPLKAAIPGPSRPARIHAGRGNGTARMFCAAAATGTRHRTHRAREASGEARALRASGAARLTLGLSPVGVVELLQELHQL